MLAGTETVAGFICRPYPRLSPKNTMVQSSMISASAKSSMPSWMRFTSAPGWKNANTRAAYFKYGGPNG